MYSLSQRGPGTALNINEPCVLVPYERDLPTPTRCVRIITPNSEQIDAPWGGGLWLLLGVGTKVLPTGDVSLFGMQVQGAELGLQTPATISRG